MNAIGQSMLWNQEMFDDLDEAVDYMCNEKSEDVRVIYW